MVLSIVGTSALANTKVYDFLTEFTEVVRETSSKAVASSKENAISVSKSTISKVDKLSAAPMFMTIIQGADEEVICNNDGSTVARFNLCGDFDDRTISLNQSGSTYQWQQFNTSGSCTFDVDEDCANTDNSCWVDVASSSTFNLDASGISAANGAEFRVRVNSGAFFYFKVKKSTITQTTIKRDFICGVPGRIQVTNLSSAYEYSIDSGSGFGPWQGAIFDGLLPGTYVIRARLQNTPNTCEYPYEPIIIEQQDIDIDVTFIDAQCSGETGSITVQVNNVPGPYKYTLLDASGVPQEFTSFIASDTYTFSAVGFGTYGVQVETQQCTGDPLNGILPPRENVDISGNPITIGNGLVALSASTEVNNSFGCNVTDVDIIVRTSGGNPPYTFTVSDGGSSSGPYTDTSIYNVTTPGTYDFDITDANGCTITASADVEELTPPDVTVNGIDGTCTNGGAKLDITIIDAKGYNLSFRAQPSDPWSSASLLSVAAGTYNTIQVRYQQGGFDCTLDLPNSITVVTTDVIVGNAVKLSDRTCNASGGVDGGVIEFQGPFSGGSGSGYEFSISGGSPSNFSTQTLYTNLAPGTYTPIIRDDGGCQLDLTPITILDVDPPTAISFDQNNINCASGTTDVQLTVTSNAPIVLYEVINPVNINNGGSDTFSGLNTNTAYEFRVTDANGCMYTDSFTPAVLSSIRARVRSGGDLRVCNGASDGMATFLIDGFANNYTFNINGGPESAPQNDLEVVLPPSGAGTYTITITDADTGCMDTASVTIQESALLTLGGNVTPMTCENGNIGRVVATTTGGWGGNRYTLVFPGGATTVGPKSGATFGSLSVAGTYTLSVEDTEGCTATYTFDLTPLNSPTIALDTAASDFCFEPGSGATMTVTASGGAPGYQYSINNGALQASPTFTNLSPGTYTIMVTDSNNCTDEVTVTVRPQLRVRTNIEAEIPCGGSPGTIRVRVDRGYLSGAGSKQYEVSSDGGATFDPAVPLTTNTFFYDTALPGDYVFRVTDNEGCIRESNPITLSPPANILASASAIPASCGETTNGIATISPDASSGVPPFEISFNGSAFTSQTVYSNLIAGVTYPYIVRDARGCETLNLDITIPLDGTPPPDAAVTANLATCVSGVLEGEIVVNSVAGGTPDFTYILQDQFGVEIASIGPTASTNETFSNIVPGNYTLVTLDANGCRDDDPITVVQTTVDVVPDPVTPVCNALGFTNIVTINGGIGPFLIRLTTDPNPPVSPNQGLRRHEFTGLQFGVTYTVEVTDLGTGCIYFDEIPPQSGPTPLDIAATSTPDFCDVNRNGQLTYTVTGFTLGADLIIELLNTDDNTRITIDSPTNVTTIPYVGTYETLAGNYQLIVTEVGSACTDATAITIDQNLPSIAIISEEPANCNAFGQITVRGSGGDGGPYTYAFVDDGVTPTPADYGTETTFVAAAGTYDVYVMDASGCTSFDIATIISLQPDLPTPTFLVNNQCDVTTLTFQIEVSMPASVDSPAFTLGGVTLFTNPAIFTVNSPGQYPVDVVDINGCTSSGVAEVFEFLAASGDFSVTPTCNDADGEITITTTGGSGDFTFELQNSGGGFIATNLTGVFTGYGPGDYQVMVTDNLVSDISGPCTTLVENISLSTATPPIIIPTVPQDISCNGANDGSIDVILQPGSDVDGPITYTLFEGGTTTIVQQNNSGSFPNLGQGTYDVEVRTARDCVARENGLPISEPAAFSITATAPDFACEPSANRFPSTVVDVTVVDPGTATGGYLFSITGFENYQSNTQFEIVDNGSTQTITVYAIDGNGCQTQSAPIILNPPTDVVPTLSVDNVLTCATDERIRIDVVGTTDFTIVTANGPVAVANVSNSAGDSFAFVDLPVAGGYLLEIVDNIGGCTYPLPLHEVIAPIAPVVSITEASPIVCEGDTNGALFIEVTDYVGTYNYTVFQVDNTGARILPAVTTGSFDTTNFPDLNGDAARITNLPGGNFIVDITTDVAPECPGESNVATVRSPNGPLVVTAIEIGNVSCADNAGTIEATATGGWNNAPYAFQLLLEDAAGNYNEEVAFGSNDTFTNLSGGNYRVVVRDVEGCESFFDIPLNTIDPIQAGIREPQNLVCPGGNNAILEAFDPTTGDQFTATAGATGGVAGAGYIYQLIYLGSNDITDELSRSGLQDSPTFEGNAGSGFISEGWYAIEVSSGFGCIGTTVPYFVNPPPAVIPNLVQVQAPGCGGIGQMQLSIVNPEVGFDYEYRPVNTPDPLNDPFVSMGPGITSVLIGGGPGFYQFDVRKINAANTCDVVTSNGLTLVDAQNIDLVVNLPDDISCASELDGRIESFASGGIGINQFTLYIGDPGDPFNPNATATAFRPAQSDGTFEGLPEGTQYYVAVTSGTSCSDVEGPYEIVRPAPILFETNPSPVSCFGNMDGSIEVTILSGGEGLIQFAISPNFTEFFSDSATPGQFTFEDLNAGTYEILMQDEKGCSEFTSVTIIEPSLLEATSVETDETCIGFADGTAQLTITGGTPFTAVDGTLYYETSFNSTDEADFQRNDSLFFDNLASGNYVVFVRDAGGCQTQVIVPIEIGVNLMAEPLVEYGCDGIFPNSTTTIALQDNSVLSQVLFSLDVDDIAQADTQNVFGDLPAGDHTVYLYHENGCATFVEFSIDAFDPLTLDVSKTGPNEMTATAMGGFGGYEFFFQGESTGAVNVFNLNEDTLVTVRVVDQNGCELTVTVPFDFTGMLDLPNFFTPNGDNLNETFIPGNSEFFPNLEVKIYDRYGRVVAILNNVQGWDGTYEGKPVPTGDYWYVVNANDFEKQQYVGHFTLYR